MKNLSILGVTGSIGTQTVDVCLQHPDMFTVKAVSAGHNIDVLKELLKDIRPELVSVRKAEDAYYLKKDYPDIDFVSGSEGLEKVASYPGSNLVVNALVGSVGLVPSLAAIKANKDLALANKESLVIGGELVYKALKQTGRKLVPIDSEHSAILQCLQGNKKDQVRKLIITASGGSFRDRKREELAGVTKAEALAHPNWSMGQKITIDSATMMNKGFEVIEAHWLFDMSFDDIEVVMHKESVIHSMVEYNDGAVMAQLGSPDMRRPIQYALCYPDRFFLDEKAFSLTDYSELHFAKPDYRRFPLLELAYKVGRIGGNLPAIMNAANEEAVRLFLDEKIDFLDIEKLIFDACENIEFIKDINIDVVLETDRITKEYIRKKVG